MVPWSAINKNNFRVAMVRNIAQSGDYPPFGTNPMKQTFWKRTAEHLVCNVLNNLLPSYLDFISCYEMFH